MKIKIWGCRGSHPMPGKKYARYGGNTSCIEVMRAHGQDKIIFDAGTGLGILGLALYETISAHIFLTHLHPDHIFSLPHFKPLYEKGNKVAIYLMNNFVKEFEPSSKQKIDIKALMGFPYYPINPLGFPASISLNTSSASWNIQEIKIRAMLVKHYHGAAIFKVADEKMVFVYAPDVSEISTQSKEIINFCFGANLIIWDSLYERAEINRLTKQKHSSYESVIELAAKTGIQRVIHFHHSPLHDDSALERMENKAKIFARKLQVENKFSRDNMIIEL